MQIPIILETDFGYNDPYVGIMKGVIKNINPGAEIIDLTHGIPEFDIGSGAYALYTSFKYFPENSVFTIVIDPGVGSSRKPILIDACKQFFIGPDNGIIYPVVESCSQAGSFHYIRIIDPEKLLIKVSEITGKPVFSLSKTFHGRDIFAPSAALLSLNVNPEEFAPTTIKPNNIVKYNLYHSVEKNGLICFRPIYIDRFGNIALSIAFKEFASILESYGEISFETIEGGKYTGVIGSTFSDVPSGSIVLYSNSFGFLEIGINKGSAVDVIGKPDLICFKH
ncbi:MAG: SAM-dependent chlorinase/fluorinase [Desulfurococcales archaeon]|nr:SAM-dependent chlorinase/fluorinase [Desulfurococcales archaeon]